MFTPRHPSVQWEALTLPNLPGCTLWAWYFAPHDPASATVTVPQPMFAQFGAYLTARQIVAALGWPIESVASWRIGSNSFDPQAGGNPILDQPLPPMPGVELEVVVSLHPSYVAHALAPTAAPASDLSPASTSEHTATASDPMEVAGLDDILAAAEPVETTAAAGAAAPQPASVQPAPPQPAAVPVNAMPYNPAAALPVPQMAPAQVLPSQTPAIAATDSQGAPTESTAVADPNTERILAAIEADWLAIQQLERQLEAVTKQLNGQAGKLQSLNRDLNAHERMAADSNDIKAWTDVRRMLREAAALASRQVRAFDIGTVSAAGNRNRFQDVYENYVQKRQAFDNMASVAHEFEAHRKTCQSLLTQSTSALSGTQRDAEGKARAVLSRISNKARSKR